MVKRILLTISILLAAQICAQAQGIGGKAGAGGKGGFGGGAVVGASHTFTHAQTTCYVDVGFVSGVTQLTCSLGSVPDNTKAHIICVAIGTLFNRGPSTVKDENSNSYSRSPNAQTQNDVDNGSEFLYYFLSPVGGNAGKSITVTLLDPTSSVFALFNFYVDDFTTGATVPTFDMDAAAAVIAAGSTTTTLPALTPAGSGRLLYAAGGTSDGYNGVGGSWVQNDHGPSTTGNDAAYILSSSSGSTAVAFVDPNVPFDYGNVGMAWK